MGKHVYSFCYLAFVFSFASIPAVLVFIAISDIIRVCILPSECL